VTQLKDFFKRATLRVLGFVVVASLAAHGSIPVSATESVPDGVQLPTGWTTAKSAKAGVSFLVNPEADGILKDVTFPNLRIDSTAGLSNFISLKGTHKELARDGSPSMMIHEVTMTQGLSLRPVGWCESWDDSGCDEVARSQSSEESSGFRVGGNIGIPICTDAKNVVCIEGIRSEFDGVEQVHSYLDDVGLELVSSQPNLPSSVRGLRFTDNTGSDFNIFVSATIGLFWEKGEMRWNHFDISVLPTRVAKGSFTPISKLRRALDRAGNPSITRFASQTGSLNCLWVTESECGQRASQQMDRTFSVSLRLPNQVGGWMAGRLKEGELSVSRGSNYQSVEISGKPVNVPSVIVLCDFGVDCDGWSSQPMLIAGYSDGFGDGRLPRYLQGAVGVEGGVSAGYTSHWNVHLQGQSISSEGRNCNPNNEIVGMVTTNATWAQISSPQVERGYFTYRIAGVHKNHRAEVELGNFSFNILSDYLSCELGGRSASPGATVQVLSGDSVQVVSTSVFGKQGDYFVGHGTNITFSEKIIRVQLRESQIRTLSSFSSNSLSNKLKSEIKSVLAKADGNTKFICTGIRYVSQPVSENVKVRARAKAACDYAKSLNPKLSTFFQTKTTKARSFNGKVLVVSK
jgi:hypothetical protein